ncbi:MAG: T9SS type A sorting domain-containing protein [Candidatus Zhuqueibacterota bacterium]
MFSKVTISLISLMLVTGLCVGTVQAQVTLDTGKIGVRITNAGSIRLMAPTSSDDQQLSRINIIAALSEDAVCDYNEDQDAVIPAYQLTTPTIADVEAIAVYDNRYTNLPPDVTFRLHAYAWNNEPFMIAKYTIINDSTEQVTLSLGLLTVPRIAGNYGGETDAYDEAHRLAYCYREGEAPHAGFRLLSMEPHSFHALDWLVYSPADPNADAATDSTRYHMTADAGFDTSIVAGGDGSIFSLNAGAFTLAAGDSVILTYAIVYADLVTDLFAAADAAQVKYDNEMLSVQDSSTPNTPTHFTLFQNYPNPFNPSTTIRFDLSRSSDVQLTVYNTQGQLVNSLLKGAYSAGCHAITWNGNSTTGIEVGSGVYFYRLTANQITVTKKMLLVH